MSVHRPELRGSKGIPSYPANRTQETAPGILAARAVFCDRRWLQIVRVLEPLDVLLKRIAALDARVLKPLICRGATRAVVTQVSVRPVNRCFHVLTKGKRQDVWAYRVQGG